MTPGTHYGVSEQAKASKHRLDDARALLNAVRWRGAMYMAGYAVECLLKAKLMRKFDRRNLSELEDELQRRGMLAAQATVFTHHLEALLGMAQGLDRLRGNRTLWQQFNRVNRWIPAWRYSPNLSSRDEAEDFFEAVEQVLHWVENNI